MNEQKIMMENKIRNELFPVSYDVNFFMSPVGIFKIKEYQGNYTLTYRTKVLYKGDEMEVAITTIYEELLKIREMLDKMLN